MRHYNLLNLFDDFDRDFFKAPTTAKRSWTPASFVDEKENHYHLALDIPGVDREHLKVDLEDKVLSISGERRDKRAMKDSTTESYFQFSTRYSLPDDINEDELEVTLNNGVLDIVIPKFQKKAQTRSLEIKTGASQLG